ncbi:hypothetical protein Hanom_Chr07g00639071 [Helianthus anomalus]
MLCYYHRDERQTVAPGIIKHQISHHSYTNIKINKTISPNAPLLTKFNCISL